MPISHGHNVTSGVYDSAAFFVRHNPSAREFLFFGDVEPDTLSPKPRTINVWRAAAAKIPLTLSTIFIECSWSSGRADDLLYGHLSPTHLADELTALATEVAMVRKSIVKDSRSESRPARKKSKSNPLSPESLYGALEGVRVFVIHCKDGNEATCNHSINHVITDQVRALVAAKRLGADILAADQGMRIGMPTCFLPFFVCFFD
jgi:3',5'-cyclic-nucleotide phosphodiesterase